MRTTNIVQLEPLDVGGFTPIENEVMTDFIEAELISWEGTPYNPECQIKGRAVDCVRFVAAIYDFLTGQKTDIRTLPPDAALHNKSSAIESMHKLLSLYDNFKVTGNKVQPGDLIICGYPSGGPGHGMIVGKTHIWHCGTEYVCRTGFSCNVSGVGVFKSIRRLKNRSVWHDRK
jgi:cell wall-associated NlpC family hydrolase